LQGIKIYNKNCHLNFLSADLTDLKNESI